MNEVYYSTARSSNTSSLCFRTTSSRSRSCWLRPARHSVAYVSGVSRGFKTIPCFARVTFPMWASYSHFIESFWSNPPFFILLLSESYCLHSEFLWFFKCPIASSGGVSQKLVLLLSFKEKFVWFGSLTDLRVVHIDPNTAACTCEAVSRGSIHVVLNAE